MSAPAGLGRAGYELRRPVPHHHGPAGRDRPPASGAGDVRPDRAGGGPGPAI